MITTLTKREEEILVLLSYGYNCKEIARQLYISDETVVSHKTNISRKFGAKNAPHTIRRAFELGYLKI